MKRQALYPISRRALHAARSTPRAPRRVLHANLSILVPLSLKARRGTSDKPHIWYAINHLQTNYQLNMDKLLTNGQKPGIISVLSKDFDVFGWLVCQQTNQRTNFSAIHTKKGTRNA